MTSFYNLVYTARIIFVWVLALPIYVVSITTCSAIGWYRFGQTNFGIGFAFVLFSLASAIRFNDRPIFGKSVYWRYFVDAVGSFGLSLFVLYFYK